MMHICGTDFVGHGDTIEEARQDLANFYIRTMNDLANRDERELSEDNIHFRNCLLANAGVLDG